MNKHTRETIVSKTRDGEICLRDVNASMKVAIIPCDQRGIDRETQEANATLFKAAPELLEELKNVLSDLVYQISAKHGPEAASKYPSVVSARAAIAKATGQ